MSAGPDDPPEETQGDFEVVSVHDATRAAREGTPRPAAGRTAVEGRVGLSAEVPSGPRWFRIGGVLGGLAAGLGLTAGSLWFAWTAGDVEEPTEEATVAPGAVVDPPRADEPEVAPPEEPPWEEPMSAGARTVPDVDGPLAGMVVYVSAGHGYLLHRRNFDGDPIRWGLQRDAYHGLIEDLYTARFVADVLAPELEAAGAQVVALRERDRHGVAMVVDDQDPIDGGSFAAEGWRRRVPDALAEGDHASQLEAGGLARWRVTVPEEGHWYLYGRWLDDPRHDAQAVYTVVAGDKVVETVVDQRTHGGHWWKLADLCVPGGTEVEVTLTGSGGGWLSADAVRLGGGSLTWGPPPDYVVRQHAYADVSFAHQHDWLGGPEHLRYYACGTPRSDMRTRPNWVSWASPVGEEAVFLSIHTNGGRDQGAIVFAGVDSNPVTPPHPGAEALASFVEQRMVASGKEVDPTYRSLGWRHGDYSEVSPVHNRLPGALLELAYHDHPKDAARLKDPVMQRALATGIVEGVVDWREAGGVRAEPPTPRAKP